MSLWDCILDYIKPELNLIVREISLVLQSVVTKLRHRLWHYTYEPEKHTRHVDT